jgi:hypothetical protein
MSDLLRQRGVFNLDAFVLFDEECAGGIGEA